MFEFEFAAAYQLLATQGITQPDQTWLEKNECLIEKVMNNAEQHLREYLQKHTIQSILDQAVKRCNHEKNKK